MKCIHCGVDSTRKERVDGRCKGCSRPFAFDPQNGDPFTDQGFVTAVNRISMDGTVKFLPVHVQRQLERSAARSRLRGLRVGMVMTAVASALVLGVAVFVGWLVLPVVVAPMSLFAVFAAKSRSREVTPIPPDRFEALWSRWVGVHGLPTGAVVLDDRSRNRPAPPPALTEEVLDYSFDRAVICDRDDLAELLLRNDFHFENNCAVLSVGGHPRHAFPTVLKMLRNNPRIEVFALHDCTPEGCRLARVLREDPAWFAGVGTVYDVGLRPGQAGPWQDHAVPTSRAVPPDPAWTEDERAWLSRWTLTLDVVPPEQLVKRLFRSMNRLPELPDGGTGDAGGFTVVGTTSDGGGDAFG